MYVVFYFLFVKGRPQLQFNFNFKIILYNLSCILLWLMFTYCFNNEFISIFIISLLCILYLYDDERCKMNFPVRDNKVLLYCIVLYCIVLYFILFYFILFYFILFYFILFYIVSYRIVLYCIVLYRMEWHIMLQIHLCAACIQPSWRRR